MGNGSLGTQRVSLVRGHEFTWASPLSRDPRGPRLHPDALFLLLSWPKPRPCSRPGWSPLWGDWDGDGDRAGTGASTRQRWGGSWVLGRERSCLPHPRGCAQPQAGLAAATASHQPGSSLKGFRPEMLSWASAGSCLAFLPQPLLRQQKAPLGAWRGPGQEPRAGAEAEGSARGAEGSVGWPLPGSWVTCLAGGSGVIYSRRMAEPYKGRRAEVPGCPSLASGIPEGPLQVSPRRPQGPAGMAQHDARWPGAMLGGEGSRWGKNIPVHAQGGPHASKSRSPCTAARGVPGWSVSWAGDSTRILTVATAMLGWAALASARLRELLGRALPGQDWPAPAVTEPQCRPSGWPGAARGGLLPPGLTRRLPPCSMASCWTPGPPTRPCSSTSGLQTRRTTPGWSASTACATWRVRADPHPHGDACCGQDLSCHLQAGHRHGVTAQLPPHVFTGEAIHGLQLCS